MLDGHPFINSCFELNNSGIRIRIQTLGKKVPAGQSYTAVDSDSDSSEPKSETDSETNDDVYLEG